MAIPLKTGADLYNNELLRARLHNHPADALDEYGVGSFYFNNSSGLNSSDRMRYRGLTAWHSVANLEDIEDVKDLIKALSGSSSESVASVLGRVITLEGYFSNGKAKDADLLDGHNSDYFAEAATLNDLLEDYEAFKAVFSDNSDDYINTWTEVKAFLDGIKNTEDLNAILLGINTELGKKADKATTLAGYGITDAVRFSATVNSETDYKAMGYGYAKTGWYASGPAISIGTNDLYKLQIQLPFLTGDGKDSLYFRSIYNANFGDWHKFLDDVNYASVLNNDYLRLDGSSVMAKDALLKFQVGNGIYDWNARRGQGFGIIDYNTSAETPQYRLGFHIGGSHYRLDISHQWGANVLAYRIYDQMDTEVGPWISILDANNYSDLITTLNNNLNVPSITIGGIKLSVVEGQLQIEGDAYATGQLSSGGIGSEGSGSGASGIVILEDWEKYDDTLAQVLGAGLGVGLRDKIAALESKATNVSVAQTLTSGKEIGAITIDGVATKLFAPSTYAWSEITDKPISLGGYGIIDAVRFFSSQQGNHATKSHLPSMLVGWNSTEVNGIKDDYGILNIPVWSANTASSFYATQIYSVPNGANLTWRQVTASTNGAWKVLLDDHNYENLIGSKFLKLSGGVITGALTVGRTDLSTPLYLTNSLTPYTAIAFRGSTLKSAYLIYSGTGDTWEVTNEDWNRTSVLLHANNFNTYAPTLTGVGASGRWSIGLAAEELTDLNDARHGFLFTMTDNYGTTTGNKPHKSHAAGLTWAIAGNSNYRAQLASASDDGSLYFRMMSYGTWGDWKTLAFTDGSNASGTWGIDITGSAAKLGGYSAGDYFRNLRFTIDNAEKLDAIDKSFNGVMQTSNYSPIDGIYGYGQLIQFADITGTTQIYIADWNNGIYVRNSWLAQTKGFEHDWKQLAYTSSTVAGAYTLKNTAGVSVAYVDTNGFFYIGDGIYTDTSLKLIGKNIYLASGASATNGLILNSHGNVTIGASDLASTNWKLRVDGYIGVGNNYGIWSYLGDGTTYAQILGVNRGNQFYIGSQALVNNSVETRLVGSKISLYTSANPSVIVNSYGAVTIGTGDWAGSDAKKLHVQGGIRTIIDNTYAVILEKATGINGGGITFWHNAWHAGTIEASTLVLNAFTKGNVGIGTNNPACTLHIYGASTSSNPLCVESANTWGESSIAFKSKSGYLWTAGLSVGINNSDHFGFYSDTAKKVISRITPTGMVVDGDIRVTGNIIADGQVSSGGVAEAGTGAVGGSALDRLVFEIPANTTSFPCEHGLGTRDISVSIYENGNDFQQVLADVYLDSTNVARIVFGSATDVAHKVVIIG